MILLLTRNSPKMFAASSVRRFNRRRAGITFGCVSACSTIFPRAILPCLERMAFRSKGKDSFARSVTTLMQQKGNPARFVRAATPAASISTARQPPENNCPFWKVSFAMQSCESSGPETKALSAETPAHA